MVRRDNREHVKTSPRRTTITINTEALTVALVPQGIIPLCREYQITIIKQLKWEGGGEKTPERAREREKRSDRKKKKDIIGRQIAKRTRFTIKPVPQQDVMTATGNHERLHTQTHCVKIFIMYTLCSSNRKTFCHKYTH